jgi:hypothetical protein
VIVGFFALVRKKLPDHPINLYLTVRIRYVDNLVTRPLHTADVV